MGHFWTTLRMRVARLRVYWQRFAASRLGKRVIWGARQALTLGIAVYLVYRMSMIGWGEIWQSLPRTPWFYVVFLAIYLSLPAFQALAFGLVWKRSPLGLLPPMLKKRVYDKDVLDRSGDVYVYFWGRTHVDHTQRELLHHVKDNAITSSVASTLVAVGLLVVFLALGYVPVPDTIARHSWAYGGAGVVVLGLLGAAGVRFRRTVFLLPARMLGLLFGLHLARVFVQKLLLVVEWKVALPEIALSVWIIFLAVQIVTSRIPLLPGRDLIFMAAGIELAGSVDVSKAAIAGLLGVHSVLDKTLNLAVFAGVSAWERQVVDRVSDVIGTETPASVALDQEPDGPDPTASPPESSPESSPAA
jgi:hypothetical protein